MLEDLLVEIPIWIIIGIVIGYLLSRRRKNIEAVNAKAAMDLAFKVVQFLNQCMDSKRLAKLNIFPKFVQETGEITFTKRTPEGLVDVPVVLRIDETKPMPERPGGKIIFLENGTVDFATLEEIIALATAAKSEEDKGE